MENKEPSELYPSPVRGPLRPDKNFKVTKHKHVWFQIRDYSPAQLIAMVSSTVILFGIFGVVVFYRAQQQAAQSARVVAYRAAKEIADKHSAEPYDTMHQAINRSFEDCAVTPQLQIAHYYSQSPTLYTAVALNAKDPTPMLEQIVERSDMAIKNELMLYCP